MHLLPYSARISIHGDKEDYLGKIFFMMKSLLVVIFVVGLSLSSEFRREEVTFRKKRNTEGLTYFYYQQPEYPRDCKEVYDQCEDQASGGVYLIKPEGSPEPFEVYCNNSIDGGGWTVFQRRVDGSVDFYRYWNEYKSGFGFLRGEFWLGNDKISYLTNQKRYELRIDMNNVNGEPYFAKYNLFRISDEGSKYRLVGLGDYDSSSTANNDALENFRNQSFSTRDEDNDDSNRLHIATYCHGAWWFKSYHLYSHLNGLYNAGSSYDKSIDWDGLPGQSSHIKYSEMKIRPLPDP